MSESKAQPTEAQALMAVAEAIHRLTDAYLYCNAPDEEGEDAPAGLSLSDVPRSLSG